MKSKRIYVIPFIGLKTGFHDFDFEIKDEFFEDIEYSIIHKGNVRVHLELEKKETMLIGNFTIEGTVHTNCDRCNDPLELPVKGMYQVIYKFGHEQEDDESLVVLHPDAYEIDVNEQIYEFITVSLPTRRVHPAGECNEEMIALLKEYSVLKEDEESEEWEDDDDDEWEDNDDDEDDGDEPLDPRWTPLINLN